MNILISGDLYISDFFKNKILFDQDLIDLFCNVDYRIVNLEAPITPNVSNNRIQKTGPHLRMSEEVAISYLKQLSVDTVTLANNHILDYDTTGLLNTFKSLEQNKINYVGAGINRVVAAIPYTIKKDGMHIAVLNICENEWSIAKEKSPGANPMDIIDNSSQIKAAKANHDKVICIIHGGHEYYHLPSPRMQKQYRYYVDCGADIIIGHHTHCISGYELYKNVPIIYSLGNFLFTKSSTNKVWYEGFLTNIIVEKENPIRFRIHPIKQDIYNFNVSLLKHNEKEKVLNKIQELSDSITNEVLLQRKWEEYVKQKSKNYLSLYSPTGSINNRLITYFLKKTNIYSLFLNKNHLKFMLNIIRCEAHFDTTKNILEDYLNSK